MLNNKQISIGVESFPIEYEPIQISYGNIATSVEYPHTENADGSSNNENLRNAQPAFVQRFFGDAINVIRQVTGIFDGKIKTFNVYQTRQIGQNGFGHWPVPYSHTEVVALLLQNSSSIRVRELLALEIMSLFKTKQLPQTMLQQFSEFHQAYQQITIENISKENLFNKVLRNLKHKKTIYSVENYENLIHFLKDLPKRKPNENTQLFELQLFQLNEKLKFLWFKRFCTEERVFKMFVQTYLTSLGPDNSITPFTPSTALLDALLEATSPPIRLCIWAPQPPFINQVQCKYLGGSPGAPVTHVFQNCNESRYFELMADSQHPLKLAQLPLQSDGNSLKRTSTLYDPTLFGSASKRLIVNDKKESDVSEKSKRDKTNRLDISFILN